MFMGLKLRSAVCCDVSLSNASTWDQYPQLQTEEPVLAVGQWVGLLFAVGVCVNPEALRCCEGRQPPMVQAQNKSHMQKI